MKKLLTTLFTLLAVAAPAAASELRVAAAASAQEALTDIAKQYEKKTHDHVFISYGSSGRFYNQLVNGAPFDLFFSADQAYAAKLEADGLAKERRPYARGSIVLWTLKSSPLDPARGLALLTDARVTHVAIANPQLAPYGRAAMEAIAASKLTRAVKDKLLFGENISQTAQFVQSGGAEVGILALSLAKSPRLAREGKYSLIPDLLHRPIVADAVVLKESNDPQAASRFLAYCLGPEARPVWRRYGFSSAGPDQP